MERILVLVTETDGIEGFVAEAGRIAAGLGVGMVLLAVRSEADYERDRRAMDEVLEIESSSYDVGQAIDAAEQLAARIGREALADVDVDYETAGAVGDTPEKVIEIAEARGCDHAFVMGRRRSPSGKAIFGDTAQQIILNFPGLVTISMGPRD